MRVLVVHVLVMWIPLHVHAADERHLGAGIVYIGHDGAGHRGERVPPVWLMVAMRRGKAV